MEEKNFIVDNNTLEKLIKESIESKLDEIDFTYEFDNVIRKKLEEKAEEYVDKRLKEEIEKVMKEPVHTDDGWGHRSDYDSFEDLFRQTFAEKMSSEWRMRENIRRIVEDRIDELLKNRTKEVTNKIQTVLLSEIIKEEKTD